MTMGKIFKNQNRVYLLLSLLILLDSLSSSLALAPSGFIQRQSKLQILGSFPPGTSSTQQLLASPSGKFAAYFARSGKSGGDFCYIEVQGGGESFSDAGCAEIRGADTCTLVFSDSGLEIYDGNRSGWNSGGGSDHLDTLILLDSGELVMKNKDGDSSWKVTESSKETQHCGVVRTSGQASGNTPLGQFVSDQNNGEEGQIPQQPFSSGSNQPFSSGFNQPFSSQNQPFSNLNQPFSSQNPSFGNDNPLESRVSVKKVNTPLLLAMSLISVIVASSVLL